MPTLAPHAQAPQARHNPLLTESTLPFQYPEFNKIKNEHFAPAYDQGMLEHLQEIKAIAENKAKPTFENTIIAMEQSGKLLARVDIIFDNLSNANTNESLQKIQKDYAPKLAAHYDAVLLNTALFERIETLYAKHEKLGLDAEAQRLLWRYHQDFTRAGAELSPAGKAELKKINGEISVLQASFSQHTLKEVASSTVYFDHLEDLDGLTDAEIATAKDYAKEDGHEGKFAIRLVNTTSQPALDKLSKRESRQKIMNASLARGSRGGDNDVRDIIVTLAKKRAQRANLLGHPNFASYVLADETAGSTKDVNKFLGMLAPMAVKNARKEGEAIQAVIDKNNGGYQLSAADWQFNTEEIRKNRYNLDETELKPYFELNNVLIDGVFYAANKLYGLTFKERFDLPVYEPGVRVFNVFDNDHTQLAILIADFYARPNKNGGAWEMPYVRQNPLQGTRPVVAIHLNIDAQPAGEPVLLTQVEIRTMFHEFGHALHEMFSNVKYPRFAGTIVPRDFVEYPSQLNQMWARWPEVLQHYARHYQTGDTIPQALVDKLTATETFNQGYLTTESVAADMIDQAWHQLAVDDIPAADGVAAFEAATLKKAGLDYAPVPPRYRSAYFSHIFSNGYASGYYGYLWSEVLDANTVEWFKKNGGLTRANGDRLRHTLLSNGGSKDALTMFRDFTGGEPDIGPLLKRHGLE